MGSAQGERIFDTGGRIETLPGLYWTVREDASCAWVGPQLSNFTGLSADELAGHGWLRAVHPDDRGQVERTLREAGRDPLRLVFRLRRRDGDHRPIDARVAGAGADGAGRAVAAQETEPDGALRETETGLAALEERSRLLRQATRDVVWEWDLGTGLLDWHEALEETFGYPLADVPASAAWWLEQVHPDERARVQTSIEEAVADPARRVWSEEYRFRRRDGRWVDVLDRGWLARDGSGRAVRMIGSMLDITERKRVEAMLRRSEEGLRRLADALPQLVWITRPDGFHEYFNRRWYEYTGTDLSTAQGELWSLILHPDDRERTLERWGHSLRTGEPYEIEYRFRRASDGAYRWFLGRALPVRDADGRIVRWFGTCTDIDEQKRSGAATAEAKARLEVILEALPVGVFIADAEGRVVETNARAQAIWAGARALDRPGDYANYRGFRPGDGTPLAAEDWALARAIRNGETIVGDVVDIERFDGTRGTILNNAAPFRDAEGRVTGAVVVIHDLTERKRVEEALRESEARALDRYAELDQIYRYAPVGLFTFDREYRFRRINERMAEINGFLPEAHIGRSMFEVVPDLAPQLLEVYRPVLERGEPVLEVEVHGATPKAPGRERDWLCSYFPLRSGTGEVVGLIGAVLEVTERKNAERALRESEERLRDADRRKDQFLAMLSHEMRNPLAPIQNSLFILGRTPPGSPSARRAHEVIGRQVVQLTRLVDDLLDVTRIARGKIRLQRETVDLGTLVRRTAEDHRTIFHDVGVALEVRSPGGIRVDGDPARLAQVVGNLLTNAAKFTPRGGHVSISVESADGAAAVRVRDDGAGVAPGLLERLFDPFVQADATLDRSKGGLGLGLALVRGLAALHGGAVEARSDGPGKGAEFVVRLPLAEGVRAADGAAEGPSAGCGRRTLRVLLVEDNVDTAESLREALGLSGHVVELARSGFEGLEKALAFRPDVVLCDIGLPGIDGWEVARRMREHAEVAAPLVALSGYAGPDDLERSRRAGFARHLAKPPDLRTLERTLCDVWATAQEAERGPPP